MGKAPKGTVAIEVRSHHLRLRWRVHGVQHHLSLGYPDTPKHRKIAQLKANQIESDILFDRFDPTLGKYKSIEEAVKPTSLRELYDRYIDYKRPQCSPSTMGGQYKNWRKCISELPTDNPSEAVLIREWALTHIKLNAAKRLLVSLNACCNWAIESGFLEKNSFEGMAKQIRLPKKRKEEEDIHPFNKDEIDRVINLFKSNKYYKHYTPFITFCFLTGCRPSEALALEWRHIGKRFERVVFEQALVMGEDGLKVKGGLKTQDRREFPCNSALKDLLKSMEQRESTDLVFPSPTGKYIDFHNFANRGWKTVLADAGIAYRKPYQTRHTFITLALQHLSVQDVAALVGNSPEIIYRCYAGVSRDLEVPALF